MINNLLQVVSVLLAEDDFVKLPISGLVAERILQPSPKPLPEALVRGEMHTCVNFVIVIVPRDNQLMFARRAVA